MKKIFTIILILVVSVSAWAQKPSVAQSKKIIIKNATIHIGNTQVIEKGTVVFENGILTYVGNANQSDANAIVIDATGKHVYPGLIAPFTKIGLEEIESVRATLDYAEVGNTNPNVRSIIAYNTDSKIIPTIRSNGILTALIVPQGGSIPGTSSLVKLDGWNWEDAVYKTDLAVHVNWPRMRVFNAWWAPPAEEQRKNSDAAMLELKKFFDEAFAYSKKSNVAEKNLKFEAMKDIFSGKKKLIIAVGSAKEITSAVNFSKSYGITPVLAGGNDAITTLDFIKEQGVSMILEQPHALPDRDDEDVDLPFKRASILKSKGIPFCLSIDGSWQQRNLPFMAGTAAAYGLTKEEALKAVTLDAAEILGVSKTLGSLELGKDATLVISDGDLLDMRTSNVVRAFIKGAEIDLDNKQKELYRLYSEKYNLK